MGMQTKKVHTENTVLKADTSAHKFWLFLFQPHIILKTQSHLSHSFHGRIHQNSMTATIPVVMDGDEAYGQRKKGGRDV